jgi:hypothetical protein
MTFPGQSDLSVASAAANMSYTCCLWLVATVSKAFYVTAVAPALMAPELHLPLSLLYRLFDHY